MTIDKSARQHYAMQGKIKNYLGKQKMVKAPVKWKSGPDHPDTELAYITKAEKDLILKADLHSSLSKGPNRGPSGIMSLNSAGSGYGGPGPGSSGGSGGNGGGNPNQDRAREEAARANRQAAQDRAAASIREQAAQRDREAAARNRETISKNPVGGIDQFAKEVVALEDKYTPGTKLGVKDLPGTLQDYYKNKVGVSPQSQFQVTAPTVHTDLASTISKNPIGGLDQFAKEVGLLEDQYTPGTKLGLGDLPGTLQDYYKNKVGVSPQSQFQVTDPTVHTDLASTISKNPIGGLDQFAKEVGFLEDKYASGTKLGLGDLPGTLQDYYKNKVGVGPRSQFQVTAPRAAGPMDYLQKGYQPPVRTGAGMAAGPMDYLQQGYQPPLGTDEGLGSTQDFDQFFRPKPVIEKPPLRTRIQDERTEDIRKRALGNIALQTDKSLTDVSDPSRQGIMSGFADLGTKEGLMSAGKNYAKKAAINFGLQKLGLGFLNPLMGLASLFGFKMPKGTGTKTAWAGPSEEDLRGNQNQGQNVIQAGMEKFQPTDQQTAQMDEMRRKMMILQGHADKGQLNEQGMSTLAQMNQLISQYQVDPRSIYG